MYKLKTHIILTILLAVTLSYGQQAKMDKSTKVTEILKKSQALYGALKDYSFKTNYKSYGSYEDTEVLQEYNGLTIKSGNQMYLGIANTVFLSGTTKTIKIYGNEKVIEVAKGSDESLLQKNPVFLDDLLKHYKYKDFKEEGNFYICTLQTAYVTQMPYGKIIMYINRDDYSIHRQEMYMLAQLPYVSPKTGERKMGNPKIVIELTDFKKSITNEERKKMRISTYINIKGSEVSPTEAYKDFTIEPIK